MELVDMFLAALGKTLGLVCVSVSVQLRDCIGKEGGNGT
jgi:hypothetical protein